MRKCASFAPKKNWDSFFSLQVFHWIVPKIQMPKASRVQINAKCCARSFSCCKMSQFCLCHNLHFIFFLQKNAITGKSNKNIGYRSVNQTAECIYIQVILPGNKSNLASLHNNKKSSSRIQYNSFERFTIFQTS